MRKLKALILGLLLSASAYSLDAIPRYQDLAICDHFVSVDMHRLLELTQMIESRGGRDHYHGRVAKTSYQYEMATAEHYIKLVPEFKKWLESEIGRELQLGKEEDARYITYLIYMSKIMYHKNWMDKFSVYYEETGDIEWCMYKVLWNSIKGASTYSKWVQRENEYFKYN